MRKILKKYNSLEENILFFAMVFSVGLIFLQIVMRYIFSSSLSWSEELARYIFVWYTWVGTSYAVSQHKHIRIEILSDMLKGKSKILLDTAALLLWAIFSFFLSVKGIQVVSMLATRGQNSAALEIPMAIPYAAIPVGCFLMGIKLLIEIRANICRFLTEGVEM